MNELISSLLDNESVFGKLMTRLGIVIGANIMFVFFCMPVITIGPAYVALYHVMLKTLRGDGVINPFKEFWRGFKNNIKQSLIFWVLAILVGLFFYVDFKVVMNVTGGMSFLRYPLAAILLTFVAVAIYTFITMAAFEDSIPHLMRNAVFFMVKNPLSMLVILFFNVFPLYLTYSDPQMMPLYAFIWVSCGFGLVGLLGASLVLPIMKPFLPLVDEQGFFVLDDDGNRVMPGQEEKIAEEFLEGMEEDGYEMEPTDEETLEMMRKLGM